MKLRLFIVVVAALGCSGVLDLQDEARVDATRVRIQQAGQQVELHALQNGSIPISWDEMGLDPAPVDAWEQELVLAVPGPQGRPYDIVSKGSDGAFGGEGVAADLRYVELP